MKLRKQWIHVGRESESKEPFSYAQMVWVERTVFDIEHHPDLGELWGKARVYGRVLDVITDFDGDSLDDIDRYSGLSHRDDEVFRWSE